MSNNKDSDDPLAGDCFNEEMYNAHYSAWRNGYDAYPEKNCSYNHYSLREAWERGWYAKKDHEPDIIPKGI